MKKILLILTLFTFNDGLNLMGNPYPAVLRFDAFLDDANNSGQIDDYIMIMKRDRSGFFSYSAGIPNGNISLVKGAGAQIDKAQYPIIQPGQEFLISKSSVKDQINITFKETYKVATIGARKALRTLKQTESSYPAIRQIIRFNLQSNETQDDATIILEEGNSANYGGNDAPSMAHNTLYTYSLTADEVPVIINFMPEVSQVNEIKLFVESTKSDANLKLNFTEIIGSGNKEIWLQDNYTQTSTQITNINNCYNFGIDKSIKATSGKNRFVLVFKIKEMLPITLTSFTADATRLGGQLIWETKTELNDAKFEVQSSVDGVNFASLKIVDTKATNGNSNEVLGYNYLDKTIQSGTIYYRLKMIDKDGTFTTSNLKKVNFSLSKTNTLIVYPSLVKDELNMRWRYQNNEKFNLEIYDIAGKIVLSYKNLKGQSYTTNVSNLTAGVYILKVKDLITNKLTAVRKFIKY